MRKLFILLMLTALFGVCSEAVSAQKKCGKKEEDEKYEQTFRNATDKTITVKVYDENCEEHSVVIDSGKSGKYDNVHVGYLFVANVNGEEKEFTAAYSNYIITIGVHESGDARESFFETVNQIRRGNNLAPFEVDEKLNQAAQWFAELLAKHEADQAKHDAVAAGGPQYANMQDVGQRAAHFGWKGVNGVAEVVAGDSMPNMPGKNAVGGYFALAWSSSTTHYAPFFDIGEQKFNRVGFAVVPASRTKDKYYAVAVFGTVE